MPCDRGSSAGFAGATIPGGRCRQGGGAPLRVYREELGVLPSHQRRLQAKKW